VDDSKLGDSIELNGGKQATVAFALIALTNDWADHYSRCRHVSAPEWTAAADGAKRNNTHSCSVET